MRRVPPGHDIGAADQEVESVGSRRVLFLRQRTGHCLNDGLDLCSGNQVSWPPLDVWPRVKDRLGVLQQLKTWGFWRELPARGSSGALLIPIIPVAGGVRTLFGARAPLVPPRVFPETLVSDHSPNGAKTWRSSTTPPSCSKFVT